MKNLRLSEYKCNTCNITFKTKRHLLLHQGIRRFACDSCDKKFTMKIDLERHKQSIHSNDRPFACGACSARFKDKRVMKRHVARAHAPKATMRTDLKCKICEKAFWTRYELGVHERTHTGECPYMCEVCGNQFKRLHVLRQHTKQVHSKDRKSQTPLERSQQCQLCGKSYRFKRNQRIHTDERPY